MRTPSAQKSDLIIQIFWENNGRYNGIENFVLQSLKKRFSLTSIESMGSFIQIRAKSVDRDSFEEKVKQFENDLSARFKSSGAIFSIVSPAARSKSPEVMEAANRMSNFLRPHKIVNSLDEADRILNRAHSRLINSLTEQELRYFDYDLFDEVMSYEKDQKMQEIAKDLSSPEDKDYAKIHSSVRKKFLEISQKLVKSQNDSIKPYASRLSESLREILRIGKFLIKEGEVQLPFDLDGFRGLEKLIAEKGVSIDNLVELQKSLRAAKIIQVYPLPSGWERNQHIYSILSHKATASMDLDFLITRLEHYRLNEPSITNPVGQRMKTELSQVLPENGKSKSSSIWDLGEGLSQSFINQPRRLNSGNGNRKERFDYDTPEFDWEN